MAHVHLADKAQRLIPKLALGYSRRRFGRVVEPVAAAAHHSGVLVAMGALETAAERGWKRLDQHVRWLAIQAAAGEIGCSWCTDFGYYEGVQQGVDPAKVRDVPRWQPATPSTSVSGPSSNTPVSATSTPVRVSDELMERLHRHFSEPEIVELVAWVALENFRSRFNAGLDLRSQGFSDNCKLPVTEEPTPLHR